MNIVNGQGHQEVDTDVVVLETPAGLGDRDTDRHLVLYIVSLFGVTHPSGEVLNGDALLVRPRGTSDTVLLSAILGCQVEEVPPLVAESGSWLVREVSEIDGHRLRFEPN